jgi:hypothetical protein
MDMQYQFIRSTDGGGCGDHGSGGGGGGNNVSVEFTELITCRQLSS